VAEDALEVKDISASTEVVDGESVAEDPGDVAPVRDPAWISHVHLTAVAIKIRSVRLLHKRSSDRPPTGFGRLMATSGHPHVDVAERMVGWSHLKWNG